MKILAGLLATTLFLSACSSDTVAPVAAPTPPAPEFAHARGYVKPPGGLGLIPGAPFVTADRVGELPVKFSWPDAGFDVPVHNQGNCGSCWAFSSVENLEWGALIFMGQALTLSEQQLVSSLFYGCGGGYFAGDYEVKYGVYLDRDCPYKASNRKCPSGLSPAIRPVQAINIGVDARTAPTLAQLKASIMQFGPLSVSVSASGEWDGNTGEMITGHSSSINHMVVIYGWDDTTGSWGMRNSWGKSWGKSGNAPVKYFADSIATEAATVLVKTVGEYR